MEQMAYSSRYDHNHATVVILLLTVQ